MTELRAIDEFEVGDKVYIIQDDERNSVGDIRKVTGKSRLRSGVLNFGNKQYSWVASDNARRILTPNELAILPLGTIVYDLHSQRDLKVRGYGQITIANRYVLMSLPVDKQKTEIQAARNEIHEAEALLAAAKKKLDGLK